MSRWALVLLLALCTLPNAAWATLSHALSTGSDCRSCHVSPTGGGLRTTNGARFALYEAPTFAPAPPAVSRLGPASNRFSLGGDAATLVTVPLGPDGSTGAPQVFGTLTAAARPHNPRGHREGRLTLLVTAESEGEPAPIRVDEYAVVFDDLMFDAWIRLGRVRPAVGEPGSSALPLTARAEPFAQDARATGLDAGLSVGSLFLVLGLFNPASEASEPVSLERGLAGLAQLGWRGSAARLAASLALDAVSPTRTQRGAVHGGVDLQHALGLPLRYLGEYDVQNPGEGEPWALGALHTLEVPFLRGATALLSYEWAEPNVELRYDSHHRAGLGLRWVPLPGLILQASWRHPWRYDRDRLETERDDLLVAVQAGL